MVIHNDLNNISAESLVEFPYAFNMNGNECIAHFDCCMSLYNGLRIFCNFASQQIFT